MYKTNKLGDAVADVVVKDPELEGEEVKKFSDTLSACSQLFPTTNG